MLHGISYANCFYDGLKKRQKVVKRKERHSNIEAVYTFYRIYPSEWL